ncbi:MAG: DUF6491 family protein, partial [Bdellovibrionota bacterium]
LTMKKLFSIIAVLTAFSSFGFANTCFYANSASSYEVPAPDTLNVRVGGRTYQLALSPCPNLNWANSIGFKTFSSWVCAGDQVIVYDNFSNWQDRCWIDNIVQLK